MKHAPEILRGSTRTQNGNCKRKIRATHSSRQNLSYFLSDNFPRRNNLHSAPCAIRASWRFSFASLFLSDDIKISKFGEKHRTTTFNWCRSGCEERSWARRSRHTQRVGVSLKTLKTSSSTTSSLLFVRTYKENRWPCNWCSLLLCNEEFYIAYQPSSLLLLLLLCHQIAPFKDTYHPLHDGGTDQESVSQSMSSSGSRKYLLCRALKYVLPRTQTLL